MKYRALVLAVAVVAAGCNDSNEPDSSTVSFTYTGAGKASATTFSATGTIPSDLIGTGSGTSPWAAGGVDASTSTTAVVGVIPRSATVIDFVGVGMHRSTVGTSPVDANCDPDAEDCTGVFLWLGFQPNSAEGDYEYLCALGTGSITITAISDARVSGTFSGTGACTDINFNPTVFTVTNGTFSVAISSQIAASTTRTAIGRSPRLSPLRRAGR